LKQSLEINHERIAFVAHIMKSLGLDFFKSLELKDPQSRSIDILCKKHNKYTPLLACVNSTITYALSCKGEEYWDEFTQFMNAHELEPKYETIIKLVMEFLYRSRCNKLRKVDKINRLRKLIKCSSLKQLLSTPIMPKDLQTILSQCLKTPKYSKTITFAIKMTYYSYRICLGMDLELPLDIPIPVDRRVALTTHVMDLIRVRDRMKLRKVIDLLLRNSKIIRCVWNDVARLSDIPPLHIDVFLWIIGRYIRECKNKDEVINTVVSIVDPIYREKLKVFLNNLLVNL